VPKNRGFQILRFNAYYRTRNAGLRENQKDKKENAREARSNIIDWAVFRILFPMDITASLKGKRQQSSRTKIFQA